LAKFKARATTGSLDVQLPVFSWLHTVLGDTAVLRKSEPSSGAQADALTLLSHDNPDQAADPADAANPPHPSITGNSPLAAESGSDANGLAIWSGGGTASHTPALAKSQNVGGFEQVVLPGAIFQRPVNPQVLYQVVRWQRAKRRAVRTSVPNIHTYQDLGYSWFPCAWRAVGEAGESTRKHDAGG
jgi:hypothetical protein